MSTLVKVLLVFKSSLLEYQEYINIALLLPYSAYIYGQKRTWSCEKC